jgi:iron complex outermembrane recepter protein
LGVSRLDIKSIAIVALALAGMVGSRAQTPPSDDLTQVSLEDLMQMEVTSVSKKEQSLSMSGAAIYVITQEDIRRSGAATIPDLIRMVPGVDVAQIDANTYAISIRGFNDRLADKVLVLIDGRTVYTPTTSGVYWDQQDVPLEDIDRIEIIRGPGGTIWGGNAVNGVINIITKRAKDTQGLVVSAAGGTEGTARGLIQYGGKVGDIGSYRVFENYSNTGNSLASDGKTSAADGWHLFHTGFRSDWTLSPHDTMTVQGDLSDASEGQTIAVVFANALPLARTFNDSVSVEEGNLLGRWNHIFANGSDASLQIYYDRYNRHDEGVKETLDTIDLDFQHHFRAGSRNDVVWGVDYRSSSDGHVAGYGKTYVPLSLQSNLYGAFVQDEIKIAESFSLIVGSKFENQLFSGFHVSPSAQLVWTPSDRHTLWASASQAWRELSREQAGLIIDPYTFPLPGGGFGVAQYRGSPTSKPERLHDVEAGYRTQATKHLFFDVSTFLSYFHGLETLDPLPPYVASEGGTPYLVLPAVFGNTANARTYGAEVAANWNPVPWWRMNASYSAIRLKVSPDPGSVDTSNQELADNSPENQFQVHSLLNLGRHAEWDSAAYYVGRLRNGGDGPVPAYTRVDTRLGWRFGTRLEVSLVGQNLLRPTHAEFHNAYEVRRTLVERSVFAKMTWHF